MPDNPSAARWLTRLVRTRPKAISLLVGAGLAWVGLCFALGYRLPWFDQHPDWGFFPALNNPRLVVEEIPDSIFAPRYSRRFPYPATADSTGQTVEFYEQYRTNIKNVRSVGFQVTDNDFEPGFHLRLWPGPTDPGTGSQHLRTGFYNFGYEYLELRLGEERGFFKTQATAGVTTLEDFYQYNQPATRQDTLFLRYNRSNYRVYRR
jgi:hypothetical protein